jgi:hypothetical protein
MADDPINQNEQGSAVECCFRHAGCVSECSEKAWLSRAQRSARFKFTLSICLIVCTNQNSSRPTVFLCLFGNVPLVAV